MKRSIFIIMSFIPVFSYGYTAFNVDVKLDFEYTCDLSLSQSCLKQQLMATRDKVETVNILKNYVNGDDYSESDSKLILNELESLVIDSNESAIYMLAKINAFGLIFNESNPKRAIELLEGRDWLNLNNRALTVLGFSYTQIRDKSFESKGYEILERVVDNGSYEEKNEAKRLLVLIYGRVYNVDLVLRSGMFAMELANEGDVKFMFHYARFLYLVLPSDEAVDSIYPGKNRMDILKIAKFWNDNSLEYGYDNEEVRSLSKEINSEISLLTE